MFVYPLYVRWPSEFDRFWNLFMCAAGELRVRYVYLYVLVVGIVLITKGKREKILFIETNNLLLWRKFGMIKNFTCGLYQEVCYHVCQLLYDQILDTSFTWTIYFNTRIWTIYFSWVCRVAHLHLPLEMGVFPIFQLSWLLDWGILLLNLKICKTKIKPFKNWGTKNAIYPQH